MSMIEAVTDINNDFLSRRELTCNFAGLAGKLKSLEAIDMVTKEFKLDNKIVIPMRLKTHVGKSLVTGIFYVYDDEGLAKKHINPTIFSRLDKSKAKIAEAEKEAAASKEAEKEAAASKEAEKEAAASKEADASKEAAATTTENTEDKTKDVSTKEEDKKEAKSE